MRQQRVHILGGSGSGKTTLARALAEGTGLVHVSLDEVFYEHVARRVYRDAAARDRLLDEIVTQDAWVTEGIFWQPWVAPAFARADKIVVLDVALRVRQKRVIKRHCRELLRASPSLWPTFFPTLNQLLQHNRTYRDGPLKETLAALETYKDKVSICETNEQALHLLGLNAS